MVSAFSSDGPSHEAAASRPPADCACLRRPLAAGRPGSLGVTENTVPILDHFRKRIRYLKGETFALYLAARHPDTPWYAKVFVAGIVAYAFSPIDLIPDFVPVLGYLDDLILVPLGIAVAIRMIPPRVLAECRARAQASMTGMGPASRIAATVIVAIWLLLAALCTLWAYEAFAVNNQYKVNPW
jgi:uncharacterized membrane protein YkvA (DUF1232 family)